MAHQLSVTVAVFLLLTASVSSAKTWRRRRRKPNQLPRTVSGKPPKYTIRNMTCSFYTQPLDHFFPNSPTYQQRYCRYDKFASSDSPIFFYTGNESPLEQYINQTGLMWELGEELEATLVFAEHRYEGQSLPSPLLKDNCMSYSSSKQAIADYAMLIQHLSFTPQQPIILFGGSYGGMLSAWMRMKYPNVVAGAIAASAPVWGFPQQASSRLDAAYRVVADGLDYGYPPTIGKVENSCKTNLLATFCLMDFLGSTDWGRLMLKEEFKLCNPLRRKNDIPILLDWAQSPWFDLAEGSFPFASSYIPSALHMGVHKLPPWPLQAACWKTSLHLPGRITLVGNVSAVQYEIMIDDGESLSLKVDWNTTIRTTGSDEAWKSSKNVRSLLASVKDAVGVWFNISKELECFNVTPAINNDFSEIDDGAAQERRLEDDNACRDKMQEGSWDSLCCNEDMNLVMTFAKGLGKDGMFWPPSLPKEVTSYSDFLQYNGVDAMYDYCDDPNGTYGYPRQHDAWSNWLNVYYGGARIKAASNILFSNGLLDPWSAAGVFGGQAGLVQNISCSLVAVVMPLGGHHTDLMYSHEEDPPCVVQGRAIERQYIQRWIQEWRDDEQRTTWHHDGTCL